MRGLTRFQKPSTLMSMLHIAVRTRIILLGVEDAVSKESSGYFAVQFMKV